MAMSVPGAIALVETLERASSKVPPLMPALAHGDVVAFLAQERLQLRRIGVLSRRTSQPAVALSPIGDDVDRAGRRPRAAVVNKQAT